jgi:hypothetical protein
MSTRVIITLWSIAIGWAIVWTVLHFSRPVSFPWVGVPAGFLFIAPLLVLDWIERRKKRQRRRRGR